VNVGAGEAGDEQGDERPVLAVDIGNSNITVGVVVGREIEARWRFATERGRTADEYAVLLGAALKDGDVEPMDMKAAVLGSVVPPLTDVVGEAVAAVTGVSPLVVTATSIPGVEALVDFPAEVGVDRVLNCAAVGEIYGGPAIVVDLGSATTFDVVDVVGNYRGGIIAPGVAMVTEALFRNTSQLPRVQFAKPERIVGKNTVECMQSGIYWGYVHMVRGLLESMFDELGARPRVVATGGLAGQVVEDVSLIDEVAPDLTLYGLALTHDRMEA
jgi:type III pantothenate kinase